MGLAANVLFDEINNDRGFSGYEDEDLLDFAFNDIKNYVETYKKNSGIQRAIELSHEVMVDCGKHYLISSRALIPESIVWLIEYLFDLK